jgi:hypothetical protein
MEERTETHEHEAEKADSPITITFTAMSRLPPGS